MTPLEINILLHFHCSPTPWPHPSPLADEMVATMVGDGLISGSKALQYKTTQRGEALVWMLCDTPLPEQVFVDPRVWNKSLGATIQPPKVGLEPDLSARCRHCGHERGYHSAVAELCRPGATTTFEPAP